MQVRLVVEGLAAADEVGADQVGAGAAEDVQQAEQALPADRASRGDRAWIGQPGQTDLVALKLVGADEPDSGMRLPEAHHPLQTLRQQPVVGRDELAPLRPRRDPARRDVVVGDDGDVLVVGVDPEALVAPRIGPEDLAGRVGAGIVDQDVFPPIVGLGQHALDAMGKVRFAIVDRRQNRHERPAVIASPARPWRFKPWGRTRDDPRPYRLGCSRRAIDRMPRSWMLRQSERSAKVSPLLASGGPLEGSEERIRLCDELGRRKRRAGSQKTYPGA